MSGGYGTTVDTHLVKSYSVLQKCVSEGKCAS